MIVVTGTWRSGTSLWMQLLVAAGFPPIGEAFPAGWGATLRAANPLGFWESSLVGGIYYATNPHPDTGEWLAPAATRDHVVKVFVPGLVRTDFAFLDRVIGTVRPWRAYAASLARLRGLSDPRGEADVLDPALRWWSENFALLRDVATRGYPAHLTTYDRLLRDPEREIAAVFEWLGGGDRRAAAAAVVPELRSAPGDARSELAPEALALCDALYDAVDRGHPLDDAFVERLNAQDRALRPQLLAALSLGASETAP